MPLAKCCGVADACAGNKPEAAYQPLHQQLTLPPPTRTMAYYGSSSLRMSREGHPRTPRDHVRKLSARYDVVRPAGRESEQLQSHRHLPVSLRNSVQFSTQQHQQTQHQQQQQQQQQQHNHPHRHEPAVVLCYCQPPPTINNCQTVSRGCALHPRLDQPVTNSTSSMDSKKIVQMSGPITTTAAPQQPQHQQVSQQPAAKTKESGTPSISGVRRRSAPTQGLRSPAAKRPVSAPVALQGWLHKQGSEGLMLWKKRWFVLSEYCLFYYKGPEEEKLLGSILLPSYRITVCRPEDKINKKFAFKAEHANMRTYHFAADTREAMNQWVNALTLASLLQDPNPGGGEIVLAGEGENGERSARPSVSSISSTMNQSADDSDSGFHGFQSRDEPSNNNSSPNSVNTGSFPGSSGNSNNNNGNNNDTQPQPMVNGWMQHHQQHQQPQPQQQQPYNPQQQPVFYPQRPRNYGQPVYANAPPKPRRMSDNPSPSPDGRLSSKSPLSMEYVDARTPNPVYGVQRLTSAQQQNLRTDKSGLNYGFAQPSERRTPDTYGRSSAKPNARRQVNGADYEDVYAAPPPQLYQRPAGPVGYTKGSAPTPITVPVYAQQQQQQQQPPPPPTAAAQVHPQYYVVTGPVTNAVTVMRQQQQPKSQQPPRPHSADFLEYEATRSPQTLTQPGNIPNQTRCPQRPKSSLDIINPSDVAVGDNYFYSEERYAAQMRQSAVYFHQAPPHLQQTQPSQQQHQQQLQQQQQLRNPSLSRATTPSKSSVSRDTESGIGTLSEMSCTSVRRSQREHPHQPHSLQRHTERTTASEAAHIRRSLRESRNPALIHGGGDQSPGRSLSRECQRRWPEQQQQQQQQQFARSASARLPRNRPIIDYDDDDDEDDDDYAEKSSGQDSRDGERKIQQREESMKRLLEWKQRMLQSPLTRKPTAGASSSSSSQRTSQQQQHNAELANCYKQQALLELAAHEAALAEQVHRHRRREDAHHRPHHPRSKSTDARRTGSSGVAALPRYNSYSSDDEASGSGSVIGRDPLPPRAVSTSQLARQQQQQQQQQHPQQPAVVQQTTNSTSQFASSSTLPRSTAGGGGNGIVNQQQQHHHHQQLLQRNGTLPVHQQPALSSASMMSVLGAENAESDYATHILKAASSGDVRMLNSDLRDPRIASPISGQRLVSPTNHLRVISPADHRVSSPSDSERHAHSQSDRGMSSPMGRGEPEYGSNPTLRQIQRGGRSRQSEELLHKRGQSSSRRSLRPTSGLVQVSAGELLGRTHEELVLLLIQLRRQSATLCKAMETCHMEIEAQARLVELDTPRRLENLQKLEELKKHLMDLEKQYEKGKPLVNLVDNMVKLGSLYNCNKTNGISSSASLSGSQYDILPGTARDHRDRLEFNQRIQEQRLLAEERRDWDRLSPDHGQLQAKVQQLYKLDQLLQEESGTLHSLQQNKELLEKALGGLRHKMQDCSRNNPAEAERYREQQLLLERELSRVRLLLAHNSKVKPVFFQKLEETVAENARLEQDLVVLRQKLQASRRYAGNMQARDSTGTSAALEKELRRVQQLVGDLQRQRQELSVQVRQLTEKSHSLVQQIKPQASSTPQVHQPKKRTPSSWLETDLDSGITQEHGSTHPSSPASCVSPHAKLNGSPYQHQNHYSNQHSPQYAARSPNSTSSSASSYCTRQVQGQPSSPQNCSMSTLSPQLREQIQQHQLKQQLLKDQMQGKAASPVQQNSVPLYANAMVPDPRRVENIRHCEHIINGGPMLPPEYIPPPPPPPPVEEAVMMNGGYGNEDDKYSVFMQNREKQEIKTVRIVKRESERRQRDRGDRTGNLGIPLTNGFQTPGGAKRLGDDDYGEPHQYEVQLDRVIEETATPMMHAQSSVQLSELGDMQFQRSMSLPRGFGGQRSYPGVHQNPVVPPPRSDSVTALRNMMARHRVRGMGRARDDLDMERALRPRINAPDVVRSTLSHKELKYNESTIDQLLGTPNKIIIPERYVPEKTPELTAEEKEQRLKKAESIRKMLSETTVTGSDDPNIEKSDTLKKKVAEEKRQREHILQLNQILAKQVMEKSKMVAANALATLPLNHDPSFDDDDLSPMTPLPLYQQRDNYYS
ncbi:uncharacterized protein LOC131663141 isoform X10 [Phymastichus coffea]|uniref:uncharacterized protein LOC131663141 isoform X10 n=1 Tax=Phymastichus coffea TaxID=108790 RepID=UPI00273B8309|nr:uncharacterized protein LOC131663141 isoform X10 [Phymastichus coffea]